MGTPAALSATLGCCGLGSQRVAAQVAGVPTYAATMAGHLMIWDVECMATSSLQCDLCLWLTGMSFSSSGNLGRKLRDFVTCVAA